jgi:hypothetical protein
MFTRSKLLLLLVAAAGIWAGCDKELQEDAPAQLMNDQDNSYIRVIHAAPNFATITGQPDAFNLIVSGAKVNSTAIAYTGMFPGTSVGYVGVTSGLHWIKISRPGVNTNDSITIQTLQKVLEPGQRYSLIVTDSIKSTNEAKWMLLKDNFNTPVPGNYAVRFVHAVLNDTVGKTVDVYSFKRKANIFTNVKIGEVTGFVEYGPAGNDTLSIRRPGVTTWGGGVGELARLNAIPFASGRVYTVIYRGMTATTATRPRGVMYYQNN